MVLRNETLYTQYQDMDPATRGLFIEKLRQDRKEFVVNSIQPAKRKQRKKKSFVDKAISSLTAEQRLELLAALESEDGKS